MEKKHILHVNIDNDGGNGAFTLVRYLYSFLKDEFIFDYFTMGKFVDDQVYKDIVSNGGVCFSANLRKNKFIGHLVLPFRFYRVLKNNSYEIVHIHSEVAYKHFLYAVAARLAKVKKIVIHSHSSDIDGNNKGLKYIFHRLLRKSVNHLGTDFLACSDVAAEWMFTQNTLSGEHFKLLHNGINPRKYIYSEEIRNDVRKNLHLQDKFVLGHVGALKKVKNQIRLIEILNDINDDRYVLLLIGDGEDKDKLVNRVKQLNLEDKVFFLGNRTDVSELLQAIDVFVFPSFFEGIPMALIEAQTVGIPIIASDSINKDIKINENVYFVSLKTSNIKWAQMIKSCETLHMREHGYEMVSKSDYNIKNSAQLLKAVYEGV